MTADTLSSAILSPVPGFYKGKGEHNFCLLWKRPGSQARITLPPVSNEMMVGSQKARDNYSEEHQVTLIRRYKRLIVIMNLRQVHRIKQTTKVLKG